MLRLWHKTFLGTLLFVIDNNHSHFVFQWQVLWDLRKRDCWKHNLWRHRNSKRGPIFCYWALSVSVYSRFLLSCANKLSNVIASMIQWVHNQITMFFSVTEKSPIVPLEAVYRGTPGSPFWFGTIRSRTIPR